MKHEPLTANLRKSLAISGPWSRRKPAKGEALPRQIDVMHSPVYVPPPSISVRQGGDDHKQFKSSLDLTSTVYRDRGHL